MPKRNTTKLVLDHIHCRAICDEIGERFRDALRRDTPEIPPRLLLLLDKLAQLEQMPSIVPSLEEISGAWCPEPFASVKRSADLPRPATNRDQPRGVVLPLTMPKLLAASARRSMRV
jgi:hypothetical protein